MCKINPPFALATVSVCLLPPMSILAPTSLRPQQITWKKSIAWEGRKLVCVEGTGKWKKYILDIEMPFYLLIFLVILSCRLMQCIIMFNSYNLITDFLLQILSHFPSDGRKQTIPFKQLMVGTEDPREVARFFLSSLMLVCIHVHHLTEFLLFLYGK